MGRDAGWLRLARWKSVCEPRGLIHHWRMWTAASPLKALTSHAWTGARMFSQMAWGRAATRALPVVSDNPICRKLQAPSALRLRRTVHQQRSHQQYPFRIQCVTYLAWREDLWDRREPR